MIGGLYRKLTGAVDVSENGHFIRISGVAGQMISEDIKRLLKTSVVGANMFSHVTNYSVEFPTFFALEMDYLLRTMIESKGTKGGRGRYIYSSKATLQLALDELREKTWLSKISEGQDVPLNLKNLDRIKYPLLDHQKRFLAWYAFAKDRYSLNGMLLTAAAGGGKAQPLYSNILLADGTWTTMGEITVGTTVMNPTNGRESTVLEIHPQGIKDIYEITLADGKTTHACLEHLWAVTYSKGFDIVSTEKIMELSAKGKTISIPVINNDGRWDLIDVVDIVMVGQEEAQCILLDSEDHLYITDNMIVTHNTISCISVAECTEVDQVIVIAPANAVENVWAKTLEELMTVDTPHWVSKHRQKVPVPKNCKYFIYHYEDLPIALAMVNKGMIKGNICVILDESHNFNDPSSQRTQRFELLCKLTKSKNIIYSSGTPIKAMGSDTIPLLRVLDPLFTADVEARFKKIYGKNATKANELLANRLAIISYKVPKSEFMPVEPIEHQIVVDIPNANYYTLDAIKDRMVKFINERVAFYKKHNRQYEENYHACIKIAERVFTPEQAVDFQEYNRIVTRFRKFGFDSYKDGPLAKWCNAFEKEVIMPALDSTDKKLFKDAKSVYKYVDLKIRGECLGLVLGRERIAANVELAKAFNYSSIIDTAKKKTIFFSSHTEVVHQVVKSTKGLGYNPLMVTAETNSMLKQIVQKFGSDSKANPLVATYQSLSTAVPLVMANVVVALNVPFRAHEMEQAIARAYRIGQDEIVQVYYCTINTGDRPNITTRSADIMEWSKEQVNQIMGYSSREDITLDDVVGLENFSDLVPVNMEDVEQYQLEMVNTAIDGHAIPEMDITDLPDDVTDGVAGLE